jgi:hypothetical protein
MDLVLFCEVATKPFTKQDLQALEKYEQHGNI